MYFRDYVLCQLPWIQIPGSCPLSTALDSNSRIMSSVNCPGFKFWDYVLCQLPWIQIPGLCPLSTALDSNSGIMSSVKSPNRSVCQGMQTSVSHGHWFRFKIIMIVLQKSMQARSYLLIRCNRLLLVLGAGIKCAENSIALTVYKINIKKMVHELGWRWK